MLRFPSSGEPLFAFSEIERLERGTGYSWGLMCLTNCSFGNTNLRDLECIWSLDLSSSSSAAQPGHFVGLASSQLGEQCDISASAQVA